MKTFESRMRHCMEHELIDEAIAIAREADQIRNRAIEVIEDVMPSMTDWVAKAVARSFLEELKND